MVFDYIFLDLDGPVLEGKYRHYQCYKDIIDVYGGDVLNIDTYWDMKRSKVSRDIILSRSNFKGSYQDFLTAWMSNIEKEKYLKLDFVKPEAIETIKQWENVSDKTVLVTMRQNRVFLINQLKSLGVYSILHEVIQCPPQKNNAKYESLKDKKFTSAIFIGDTEEDTNTAKMLRIKSIGITNGLRKKEFLSADYYSKEIKDINFFELEVGS